MNFFSTRNKKSPERDTDCILKGLADDGGLFVPSTFPKIDLKKLLHMDYIELASYVTSQFFDSFTYDELKKIYTDSYKGKFLCENMINLKCFDNFGFIELFHGPTSAFKDMALQALPNFVSSSKKKYGIDKETVILTATSGDTGSAAIKGFESIENLKIIVLYPTIGVSEIQRKQMTTSSSRNTYVIGIDGNFDDAQRIVKKILNDKELKSSLSEQNKEFSSANSINIGRLIPQIVYYIYSYINLVNQKKIELGEKINISVPTGNFGNILAAYYGKTMGLPINKLICSSNKNNVLSDFIETGIYNKDRKFFKTNSPSMDILVSSNLERFLFHTSNEDDTYIKNLMFDLVNKNKFEINYNHKDNIKNIISGYWIDENETEKIIGNFYNEYNYLMDPHTAVGYYGYTREKENSNLFTLIAATASPFKFPLAICSSLGIHELESSRKTLESISSHCNIDIPDNLISALDKKDIHTGTIAVDEVYNKIKEILGVIK